MSTAPATPTGGRLRLVELVRISKDRDNETSTATQPYEIRQWADAHNMDIVESFTEVARSGFKVIPRPKLEEALAMVRNGLADGIIVWKVDRFTRRGAKEIFRMLSMIGTGGFLIASSDAIDTRGESMADIIKLTVIAEVAKAESEAKSERTKSWHRGRMRGTDAKPLPPTGRRPFGYDRPSANVLKRNDAEAKALKEVAKQFLAGTSLRALVRDLNEHHPRERPWTHKGISEVLKSPTNLGGRIVEGEFIRGDWEPIIDVATWEAINDKFRDPSRRSSTTTKPQWLLTGIGTCGKDGCDGSLRVKRHKQTTFRYACLVCGSSIDTDVADKVVEGTVLALLAGDGWKALRASGRTHDAGAIEFLTARLAHARKRWMDGKDSDAEWDVTKDEINARLDAIRNAPVVELPDVADIASAWNHPTKPLDLTGKRQVITAATQSIRILPHGECVGTMRVEVI